MTAANIPPPSTPLFDQRGLIATEWYRYLVGLQGSVSDDSGTDAAFLFSGGGGSGAASIPDRISRNIRGVSGSTQVGLSDFTILCNATAGPISVTLPTAAANKDRVVVVKKIDITPNTVSIVAFGSELVDFAPAQIIATQWQAMRMQSDGATWYLI